MPRPLRRASAIAIVVCAALAGGGPARAQPAAAQPSEPTAAQPSEPTGDVVTGPQRLAAVEIAGHLTEKPERLERFLGLVPGAPFGESDQNRVNAALKALGYRQLDTHVEPAGPGRVRLRLTLEPVRIVRNIVVRGNWPLFDDEVIRHLTLRTGQPLPADAELRQQLDEEAEAVRKYLFNEGYFEAAVTVEPHVAMVGLPSTPRPQWIDLLVRVDLGSSYKLADVEPTYDHPDGAQHLSKERLYDIFHHWLRFKVSQMREDQRAAEKELRDQGFPAARVVCDFDFQRDADRRTHRIVLPVHVSLKRKVEVRFVGNRAITARDLRDQLTIFTAGAYDDVELGESAKAIQREYQKRGYFEARVTARRQLLHPTEVVTQKRDEVEEVVFTIDEGPELKVRQVDIVSESGKPLSFDPTELKDKADLETKPFPPLGSLGLGEGGYVTQTQLAQDADRLASVYKARGFPSVKVRFEVARDPAAFESLGAFAAEVTGAGGGHDLYVRFIVDEGHRELVDHVEIEFVGDHVKNELDVLKAVQLGYGAAYTQAAEEDDLGRIRDLYKSSGHAFVRIDPTQSEWNAAHDRVTLRYRITEGPLVRFGEILIRGNFKTHYSTIRADLPFHPGDVFDYTKIEAAERNLQTHLIFNSAHVQPLLEEGNPVAPVLVTVQERYLEAYGSLTFAIGAASDRLPDYAYVSASYLWSNVLGFGSQFELKGDLAWLAALLNDPITMGLSARYSDVRLFGPGWRLDLSGFVRKEVTARFGQIFLGGASLAVTRNLTLATRLFARYDFYVAGLSVGFLRLIGSNDNAAQQDQTYITKAVVGVSWDRRVDATGALNPLAPVKGWMLSGLFGYAHPNGTGSTPFLVFDGQAIGILPFKLRKIEFTLMANARYDHGIPLGGESALPLVERFYAGGDTTTRGYATDELKTELVRTDVSPLGGSPGFRVVPEGGNIRFLNTIELQFPIAKTFLGLPFQWVGAVFWDVGAITNSLNQLEAKDFKHSIGFTVLRIITPVGPMSLEYAYPLNPGLAEDRWKTAPWYSHWPGRIHFNWGIPLSRL